MSTTVKYSGESCASGIIVPFSGISLPTNQTYRIEFSCISRMPESTYTINPTGFFLSPSDKNLTLNTIFSARNQYTLYNSSSNIVKLSIYNSNNSEIYRDYAAVYCGNLSIDPIMPTPTPTISPTTSPTPTFTPTNTPTATNTPTLTTTPTPSNTPPISFSASFPSLVNSYPACGQVVVTGIANGIINKNYQYSFTSEGIGELGIGNQTGIVTITQNPTYVYTTVNLQKRCENYSLKFGLSDGVSTVQSIAFFRCGNCSN